MLRRVLIYICIVVSFVACSKDKRIDPNRDIRQTTLMYFMGTSLRGYYNNNISDVKRAVADGALGSHGQLYYLYPLSSSSAVLYELRQEGGKCVATEICDYDDFKTTNAGSLAKVLADVKINSGYSSDRGLNLIVGSHGFGWRLSPSGAKSRSGGEEYYNPLTRYLGTSSDGYLDISDFCNDLEGNHFDYILFDACFMSSVEALYRMRSYSDYVVASPCEVLTTGFPYEEVIPELFENDGSDFDLAGVCYAYYDFYNNYSDPYGAISYCVMSELEALAESVKGLELRSLTTSELKGVQAYEYQSPNMFYDLGDLIQSAYVSGDYDAFEAQLGRAFPEESRLHTERFLTAIDYPRRYYIPIESYSGVSTSQMSGNSWATGWSDEPWAVAIGANN